MNDFGKIEAYLAALPPQKRAVLEDWRRRIKAFVPDAFEVFSYGMPMFKWRGKGIAAYAAHKSHFGYYPVSSNIIVQAGEMLADLKTSKGAIHFTSERRLTDKLLENLLNLRMAEINEG